MFGWMQHRAVRDEVEQRTRPEGGDTDGLDLSSDILGIAGCER